MAKKLPTPDKNEQILRAIAMKREVFFQMILANLMQNESVTMARHITGSEGQYTVEMPDISAIVELALEGADKAIELLYPIKTEE
jgi:hypothetical protein